MVAEAIHLVGIYGAEDGMLHDGILPDGGLHLGGEGQAARRQGGLAVHFSEDFGGFAEYAHGKEVGRNQEVELGGVVGRAEAGGDESHGLYGMSPAGTCLGVQLTVGHAQEIIRSVTVFALLYGKGFQDVLNGLEPLFPEDGSVAGGLPIMVGQAHGIAVRVNLPLAFVDPGAQGGAGVVRLPLRTHGTVVEAVGVRVQVKQHKLAVDNSGYHFPEMGIGGAELHVWPYLGTGIPQPHSVYVAGIDEGAGTSLLVFSKVDGSVQGIGEAVAEHPAELGVLQHCGHLVNLGLYGLGGEKAFGRGGALVGISARTGGQAGRGKGGAKG